MRRLLRSAQTRARTISITPWPTPNHRNACRSPAASIGQADRDDGQRRAGAKARGGQADREAAPVGEPLHRVADAGGVDRAGAGARHRRADVEQQQRIGVGVDDPADADQHTAERDRQARARARGPRRSTTAPAAGVSQVSVAMKMLKAHWISATLQPRARCMGSTNRVQAYCRLAINAMQITPSHN